MMRADLVSAPLLTSAGLRLVGVTPVAPQSILEAAASDAL
jgi:hypothetical protein